MPHRKAPRSTDQRAQLRQRGGAWLRQQRKQRGLSQREVSEHLGIDSHTFISAIESGGPALPEERWEEYAKILGTDWPAFCIKMMMYFKPNIYTACFGKHLKRT